MDPAWQLQEQHEREQWECLRCDETFQKPAQREAWNSDIEPAAICPRCESDEIQELSDDPF